MALAPTVLLGVLRVLSLGETVINSGVLFECITLRCRFHSVSAGKDVTVTTNGYVSVEFKDRTFNSTIGDLDFSGLHVVKLIDFIGARFYWCLPIHRPYILPWGTCRQRLVSWSWHVLEHKGPMRWVPKSHLPTATTSSPANSGSAVKATVSQKSSSSWRSTSK